MSDIKWIKITTDIFDDEKILMIESMPSADSMIVIWFKLLTFAGKQNNDGVFLMSNRIAYTDEMLASIFRRDVKTVRMALKTFQSFGMIEIVENVITIPNWSKHQTLDAYEKKKQRDRLYQRERRNRQKQLVTTSPKPSSDRAPHESSDAWSKKSSDITTDKSSDESPLNRFIDSDTSLSVAVSEKEGEKEQERDPAQKQEWAFEPIEGEAGRIFQVLEHCGFQMTGYTRDTLLELATIYSEAWIIAAIRRATDRGKKSLGYVKGILERWQIAGAIDGGESQKMRTEESHANNRTDHNAEKRAAELDRESDVYEKFFK